MLSSVVLMFVTLYRMVISQINKSRKKSWKKKKRWYFSLTNRSASSQTAPVIRAKMASSQSYWKQKNADFLPQQAATNKKWNVALWFSKYFNKKKRKKKSLFTGSFNILWSASLEAMLLSSFFLQRILLWRTGLTAEQLLSTVAVQSASLEEKQTNNFRIYANLSDWLSTFIFIN